MLLSFKNEKGSTLLELAVALTTLTLVAGMATAALFPFYQQCLDAARDIRVLGDLHSLSLTLDAYYIFHGEYPQDPEELELPLQSAPQKIEYVYRGGGDSYELVVLDDKGVEIAKIRGRKGTSTLEKGELKGMERIWPLISRRTYSS
ncbi:type IV pilin protein [Ammonifex thiophilus]|uniref:Type II secretion system protein n=1 Tax=Ammonifex thiophilus TaxID=444093 RepID=A0A3D8P6I5_9THEO|nr:type II secretion system protein [Ammonifex thiophilus]RDV83930.1 hypothetical protein DXX99_03595 [Ammonifex thiophilus]